jgi:valyl-tRNA synthetase
MYVVEDILIRYHRMRGFKTLWEPGADHAGFETQFVFEKKLAGEGKSRFDYDRETLYKMILEFVQANRPVMEGQLRKLGFSLDWSRKKMTIDPEIVEIVYKNFKKLYDEGLVYRAERLVNYCTFDGTSFSDLEVVHEERTSPLYYIKYGPLVLATTRPETKFGDTAVAVNPQDDRYKDLVGQEIEIETVLGKSKIKVVADEMVDMEFGTGAVKITPAHDFNDFEVAKRHNLPLKQVIGFDGKMMEAAGEFAGLYVKQARRAVVEKMQEKGLIEKIDENYKNRVGLCYKCKNILEPLPKEQWFIKMEPLAAPAIAAVKKGEIRIHPKSFEKLYFQFLENIRDWNISRQVVWGIQIPAWKNKTTGEWKVTDGETPEGNEWGQDSDTFDTWFSSSQWPFATLMTTGEKDYETFYPTDVMETGYDILRWWVARMAMMGIYATGKVPFKNVVLHGLVNDPLGKKMSKSKGNVINPLELVDEYGADAVRFALVYGTALGNDQALSYPKLEAARRFTNKLWNMGRYIIDFKPEDSRTELSSHGDDKAIIEKLNDLIKKINSAYHSYRFNDISEMLYEFAWHEFADKYVELTKERRAEAQPTLEFVYINILKLLHPIMPFVTEELFRKCTDTNKSLMIEPWPSA